MSWYARSPRLLTRQVASDLALVVWALLWWWISRTVDASVRELADPMRTIAATTGDVSRSVSEAGGQVGRVPAIGGDMARPFQDASGQLDALVVQAEAQAASIERTALLLGILLFVIPLAAALWAWLPGRLRFVRRHRAARALVGAGADLDLFAWRALTHQPLEAIATISPRPVAEVRAGNPQVIRQLARLELEASGVMLPPEPTGRTPAG